LAAEVVTADGSVLMVDASNHPDLFWALRGGGGNFGVVSKFKFQLHPLKEAYGGLLFLPAQPDVLTKLMAQAEKAPDELSIIFNVMPAPPMPFLPADLHGKLSIMAMVMYAGDPAVGEKVLAPFRNLTPPLADMLKPMRYKDIFFPEDGSYHPLAVSKTMMMDHVDTVLAESIIHQLKSLKDAPMRAVQLRILGGKMARVPTDDTAYAHRKSKIMVNIAAFYTSEAEKESFTHWIENVSSLLFQGDSGVYIGFLGQGDEDKLNQAYPDKTLEKLQAVKKKYDPTNFFHRNFNVGSKTKQRTQ
jgi:FAD/FMN-containing dehydrogenase